MNPYTLEFAQYYHQMRNNPEAMVRLRNFRAQQGRTAEEDYEEESQEFAPQAPRRRRSTDARSRSRTKEKSPARAELSDESDDDLPRRSEFLKDFQQFERERKRQEREERKKAKTAERALREEQRRRREQEADEKRRKRLREANSRSDAHLSRPARSPVLGPSGKHTPSPGAGSSRLSPHPSKFNAPHESPSHHSPMRISSPSISGNNRASSPVGAGDAVLDLTVNDSGDTTSSSSETDDPVERRRRKALSRMLPRFMWAKAAKPAPPKPRPPPSQARATTVDSFDEDAHAPLQPGQSRRRIARRPHDVRNIKGDPDSSDSEISVRSFDSGDSQAIDVQPSRPRAPPIDILDSESDGAAGGGEYPDGGDATTAEEDEAEEVDDADLRVYFAGDDRPKREFSIVDYMLDRARRVFSGKARKRRPRAAGRRYHRTASARQSDGGRQLKIDFSNHRTNKRSESASLHRALHHASSGLAPSSRDSDEAGSSRSHASRHRTSIHRSKDHRMAGSSRPNKDCTAPDEAISTEYDRQAEWRKRRKEKRKVAKERERLRGLHVFTTGGPLAPGSRRRQYVTVDFEDEAAYQALHFEQAPRSPSTQPKAGLSQPAPRSPLSRSQSSRSLPVPREVFDNADEEDEHEVGHGLLFGDKMLQHEIPVLPSGLAFDRSTYIGRGRLHSLLAVLSSKDIAEPIPWSGHGLKFHPSDDFPTFGVQLGKLCDLLLELATGLPEEDSAKHVEEWSTTMKAACEHATWHLQTATYDELPARVSVVQSHCDRLRDGLQRAKLTAEALDSSTFAVALYAVEMSARTCAFNSDSRPLAKAAGLLIGSLLKFGISTVIDDVRELCKERPYPSVHTSTNTRWAAQAWIFIIHVLHAPLQERGGAFPRPSLWSLLEPLLEAYVDGHVKKAEYIWRVVFGLSALSQFNEHGLTTAHFRLPAAWSLVHYAMGLTRLEVDGDRKSMSFTDRRLLEVYAGIVVVRCHELWRRCRWNPGVDASHPVIKRLAAIFKSRHYADLGTERHSDYPSFIREGRISDVANRLDHVEQESAFTLFLRLAAATIEKGMDPASEKPMRVFKARQLLSGWGPLSKVDLDTLENPSRRQLSPLFNRVSFAIAAIYLDPASSDMRVDQALQSVEFEKASPMTRISLMRGLQYMALAVLKYGQSSNMDRILAWFDAGLKTVIAEYKAATGNEIKDRAMLCGLALIGCIRRIVAAHTSYPSPLLLLSSIPRFVDECQGSNEHKDTAMREHFLLIAAILRARRSVVPQPERPRIPNTNEEESQSYDDGFDWNDPELDAVLANAAPDPELQEPQPAKAAAERQETKALSAEETAIRDSDLSKALPAHYWAIWRFLKYAVLQQGIAEEVSDIIDAWVEAHIVVKKTKQLEWADMIEKRLGQLQGDRPDCAVWLETRFFLAILTYEPMAYETASATTGLRGRSVRSVCVDLLSRSLAARIVTVEHRYLSAVLNVDGLRHPLLASLPFPRAVNGAFEVSVDAFLQLRCEAVQILLRNVDGLCERQVPQAADEDYVGYAVALFETMRSQKEVDAADEKYGDFARRVREALEATRVAKDDPRLVGFRA
ncbi:Mus7/MMS22 family-domain-containing protein [Schizophyllum fasciatum]